MKISIITPCYNASSFIASTIESVLSQTYQNWEMIIVDDCSTDNSAEVIKKYCEKDARIKYLRTVQNMGNPSEPRNIALDNAQGEYLAFLDADDMWLPNKLQEQIEFINKYQYRFVYSNYEKMTYEGVRSNRFIYTKEMASYWDILESNPIPCLTAIIKKELIGSIRFKRVPKEDYVFWLQILRTKDVVAYNTNKVHALYRESKHSRSGNKLNMIRGQWYVLRMVEGVKRIPAIYFMFKFIVKGYFKYIK